MVTTCKQQGSEYFKKNQYHKALACFREALNSADDPDSSTREGRIALLCNESLVCLKLGKVEEACQAAISACILNPKRVKSLYRLASALLEANLAQAARDVVGVASTLARQQQESDVELSSLRHRADAAVDWKESSLTHQTTIASVAAILEGIKQDSQAQTNGDMTSSQARSKIANSKIDSCADLKENVAPMQGGNDLGTSMEEDSPGAVDPSDAAKNAGAAAYQAGDYEGAIKHYSAALEHNAGNTAARGSRCAALLMLQRYEAAKADAEEILKADPSNARACSRLSKALLGCNDVAGALHWAREAAGYAPGSAPFRSEVARLSALQEELSKANVALKVKDALAARRAAEMAERLTKGTPVGSVRLALAEAQLLSGSSDAALQTSRDALRCHAGGRALSVHARALMETGNIPRALTMFQQLNREDPDNVDVGKTLKRLRAMVYGREAGNTAFKEGRYQEAHDRYTRCLNAAEGLRSTYVAQIATNRANVCLKLGRPADAVNDADLAIVADADFAKAYLRRAQASEQLGDWEAAVRDYGRVQQLEKDMAGVAGMLRHAKVKLKEAKRVDYYKLLEIDRNAGDAEVKKAYKKAALKCHPDKVVEEERPEAEKRFKLLGEANAVLTDSAKRQRYDAGWSLEEIEQGFREGESQFRGMGGGGMPPGAEDIIFSMFAGSRRPRGFH